MGSANRVRSAALFRSGIWAAVPGGEGSLLQFAVNLRANPWRVLAIADFNMDGRPDGSYA
jgi:hypothetical protein